MCISKRLSPCLSVMDDFVPTEKSALGTDLGAVQVLAVFIVGTKTRGRVGAFAPNFMPLLEDGTEFSDKWKSLCSAHLNEGIREPVKFYEYRNRYYVEVYLGEDTPLIPDENDGYLKPINLLRRFYRLQSAEGVPKKKQKGLQTLRHVRCHNDQWNQAA